MSKLYEHHTSRSHHTTTTTHTHTHHKLDEHFVRTCRETTCKNTKTTGRTTSLPKNSGNATAQIWPSLWWGAAWTKVDESVTVRNRRDQNPSLCSWIRTEMGRTAWWPTTSTTSWRSSFAAYHETNVKGWCEGVEGVSQCNEDSWEKKRAKPRDTQTEIKDAEEEHSPTCWKLDSCIPAIMKFGELSDEDPFEKVTWSLKHHGGTNHGALNIHCSPWQTNARSPQTFLLAPHPSTAPLSLLCGPHSLHFAPSPFSSLPILMNVYSHSKTQDAVFKYQAQRQTDRIEQQHKALKFWKTQCSKK